MPMYSMMIPILTTLPEAPPKDRPEHREFFSREAMQHPGRMRVITAIRALRFLNGLFNLRSTKIVDPFVGVGTTLIAAASLGSIDVFTGFDLDPRWIDEAIKMTRRHFAEGDLLVNLSTIDAADGNKFFSEDYYDILFTSPEFPNAHSQGRSEMQSGYRAEKNTVAGTEYGSGRKWRREKPWRASLNRCLRGSIPLVRDGGTVAIHVKNYILEGVEQHVDQWTAEILTTYCQEVLGVIVIPLGYRSKFQEDLRYPLRAIVSTDKSDLSDALECGHVKRRATAPAVWPSKARCLACGPIPGKIEIREERIVVARK